MVLNVEDDITLSFRLSPQEKKTDAPDEHTYENVKSHALASFPPTRSGWARARKAPIPLLDHKDSVDGPQLGDGWRGAWQNEEKEERKQGTPIMQTLISNISCRTSKAYEHSGISIFIMMNLDPNQPENCKRARSRTSVAARSFSSSSGATTTSSSSLTSDPLCWSEP